MKEEMMITSYFIVVLVVIYLELPHLKFFSVSTVPMIVVFVAEYNK